MRLLTPDKGRAGDGQLTAYKGLTKEHH